MEQAVATKTDISYDRKRVSKVLRMQPADTCNLIAFTQSSAGTYNKPGSARRVSKTKARVNQSALNRINPQRQIQPSYRAPDVSAVKSQLSPTASNAGNIDKPAYLQVRQSKLFVALAGTAMLGLVIGSLVAPQFSKPGESSESQIADSPELNPELMVQAIGSADASINVPIDVPTVYGAPEPINENQALDIPSIEELAASHLEEINWLLSNNERLTLENEALNEETLQLNRELLESELYVEILEAELDEQSLESTETRIIYNFVNVPLGSAVTPPVNNANAPAANLSQNVGELSIADLDKSAYAAVSQ